MTTSVGISEEDKETVRELASVHNSSQQKVIHEIIHKCDLSTINPDQREIHSGGRISKKDRLNGFIELVNSKEDDKKTIELMKFIMKNIFNGDYGMNKSLGVLAATSKYIASSVLDGNVTQQNAADKYNVSLNSVSTTHGELLDRIDYRIIKAETKRICQGISD